MKKRVMAVVFCALVVSLCACEKMDKNIDGTVNTAPVENVDTLSLYGNKESTADISLNEAADILSVYESRERVADTAPVEDIDNLSFYDSIEDFLKAEKQNPDSSGEIFFVPDLPPEQYQLVAVSKREDVYIALLYKVVNHVAETENLSSYDAERRTMLVCQTYLSQNGLEMFIKNGFRETIYDGKSYYVWEEHAENDPERSLNGFEIVFIQDGKRVFMYLPAIDSFENIMRYANPKKIIIGE